MPCVSCSARHSASTPGAPWTARENCQNGLSQLHRDLQALAALVYIAALRHDRTMTDTLTNAPRPITTLRDWLDHLAARDRLAVIRPDVALQFELAAIAKRLDGTKATLFPRPGGHAMPVISGLVSDRQWIAEAMGVEPGDVLARFQDAALNPLPWQEVDDRAGAGGGASRGRSRQAAAAADAQRARQRRLHHRRAGDRAQSARPASRTSRSTGCSSAGRTDWARCCCRATPTCSTRRPNAPASRSTSRSSSASIRSRCCRRRRSRRSISTS